MKSQILILGGTTEARLLPPAIPDAIASKYDIVTSFSGITKSPKIEAGQIRIGGFGGVEGLCNYITAHNVALIIDATHPFAKAMPKHAYEAAKITQCKLVRYLRPEWSEKTGDQWIYADNLDHAAMLLTQLGTHAFLALGSRDLASFREVTGLKLTARMIEKAPEENLPKDCNIIYARPPFHLNDEEALFSSQKIDILVTKNSGAQATKAKLEACRNLGIQVLMINRPTVQPGPVIASLDRMIIRLKEEFTL
ncbi:cobalt-precorrin-6A reductase [Curvivirga aplysinae]|uniref:cobalt-precorrin-6A reductase n=1 Tax=Curvivirga aplysinae TaxID=2529852 RepID=UPI0012BD7546|nr:cobalt-precorrin-6A reductase [Curvivirga aplysinae]MTI10905.1 cobalt-precorrin-6A reductase [Curvivirga aplysinae]